MNAQLSGFERGFTLIELLLALALFSIMSLLAWRGLDTVLQSRAAVETPGRAALELAAAWTQLETDLSAARLIAPSPGSGSTLPRAPYIVASAQKIALLRAPAQCAGCWEGVVYDMVASGGASVLRRSTTTVYTDAGAALTALEILAATTAASAESLPTGATGHVLLRGMGNMRISAWRESPDGVGAWLALGSSSNSVFPVELVQPASRQGRISAAVKVEWQLGTPWDGWVSKVVLLENRW